MSETNCRVLWFINPVINIVLLVIWLVATIVFKQNANDDFTWGYSCSHTFDLNEYVTYDIVCNREVITFGTGVDERQQHG